MSTAKGFQGWEKPCPGCEGRGFGAPVDIHTGEPTICSMCEGDGYVEGDYRLLRYLWKNKHHTPFEMGGLVVEVQAPIFVAREWFRHRTQSYSELSSRYTELPDLYYIPSIDRLLNAKQSTKNKQGSSAGFTTDEAAQIQEQLRRATAVSRATYELLLDKGVAREVARMILPVNQYTRFRASANLRNWLHFLELRLAQGAQHEIREYAKVLGAIVKELFPRTWGLFEEELNDAL